MVRCRKCGANNSDEARYCIYCGAPLRPRGVLYLRRRPEMNIWFILAGCVMIIYGVIKLLETYYEITLNLWPILVILFGAVLLYGSLRRGGIR